MTFWLIVAYLMIGFTAGIAFIEFIQMEKPDQTPALAIWTIGWPLWVMVLMIALLFFVLGTFLERFSKIFLN